MYAAAILAAVQIGMGLYNSYKSSKEEVPTAKATPELLSAYRNAKELSKDGFTPEQRAAYMQSLNRQNAQQYRLAVGHAGNSLAGQVQGAINFGNVNALNDFASKNAQLKQQNQRYADSFAKDFQRIDDINQQIALNMYNKKQESGGQLLNSGISNALWASSMSKTGDIPTDNVSTPTAADTYKVGNTATPNNAQTFNSYPNSMYKGQDYNLSNPVKYDQFGQPIYQPSRYYGNVWNPSTQTYPQ